MIAFGPGFRPPTFLDHCRWIIEQVAKSLGVPKEIVCGEASNYSGQKKAGSEEEDTSQEEGDSSG